MATTFTVTVSEASGLSDSFLRKYTANPTLTDKLGLSDSTQITKPNILLPSATGPGRFSYLWPGNATGILIQTGMRRLKSCSIFNNAGSSRFVKFYDKATAPVTGTDEPCWRIPLATLTGVTASDLDVSFNLGLGLAVTTGIADSDTTAPSANDVIINLTFY